MFLHSFHPAPTLLDFGFVQIRWYGLLITLSIVISFFIAKKLFKKYNLEEKFLYDFGFYLVIFGLIGARLGHVFYQSSYYLNNPLEIIQIWNGGLAIHGAVIAGILVTWIYFRKYKEKLNLDFLLLLDILAPLVILGQGIGRWGNYFNQELYGFPLDAWWSIPIDYINRLPGYESFQFFHPNFLYESLWCLLVFVFLMVLHKLRINHTKGSRPLFFGSIFLSYLFLYSIERFLIGFLRIDPQIIWLNLRPDQWLSLILIIFSIIAFSLVRRKKKVCP